MLAAVSETKGQSYPDIKCKKQKLIATSTPKGARKWKTRVIMVRPFERAMNFKILAIIMFRISNKFGFEVNSFSKKCVQI